MLGLLYAAVLDDEEDGGLVTAGAIVTVTVHLIRKSLGVRETIYYDNKYGSTDNNNSPGILVTGRCE